MADRLSGLKYYLYYKYKKRFSDRSALERWQVEKIRKHLEYVGDHSRLYKGMKKLSSYPVIDKKFMMEHFDELNTVGIGREEALEFAVLAERQRNFSPKLKGVTVGLSSGTADAPSYDCRGCKEGENGYLSPDCHIHCRGAGTGG